MMLDDELPQAGAEGSLKPFGVARLKTRGLDYTPGWLFPQTVGFFTTPSNRAVGSRTTPPPHTHTRCVSSEQN